MRKRILSIVCAIAILATVLTVGIVSASAESAGIKVTTPIEGVLVPEMWGNDAKITAEGFVTMDGGSKRIITTSDVYDLTNQWTAKSTFGQCYYWDNQVSTQTQSIKVGNLEVVVHNPQVQKQPAPATIIENSFIEILIDDVQVKKQVIETKGENHEQVALEVAYDNGTVTVSYTYIRNDITGSFSYDATAAALDFSEVAISLSCTGTWSNNANGILNFALQTADCVSSSVPASSDVSSEDASSTAPAGEKVVSEISGELVAEMWQESDKITDGVYDIKSGSKATLTSVKKYDLGTEWETSAGFTINIFWDQMDHRESLIKLGDVEIVSIEAKADKPNDKIVEDGAISLRIKGVEVQSVPVTYQKKSSKLELRATYKEGIITVYYSLYDAPEAKAITYDATSDALDFSETEIVVSSTADWSESCKIRTFGLKTADTYIEPGAPIVVLNEATFNTNDWSGDNSGIDATDGYFSPGKNTNGVKTITSKTAYYLKDGFKFAGKLLFKNSFNNYGGEYVSMYVGDPITGIELRIANVRGQGMYTGHILVKGEEVAKADLLNAPNGVYELVYKNGKLTVNLEGAAIKWTLADASTSTSVAINDVDLNKVTLGFRISGNYSSADARQWSNYSLAPVSGGSNGTNGTTGDARNLVIPAVTLVLGACAAAFVAKAKKANA